MLVVTPVQKILKSTKISQSYRLHVFMDHNIAMQVNSRPYSLWSTVCAPAGKVHTGWRKKLAPFLYAFTLPNINRFSKLFHCQNQDWRKFVILLSLKIPSHLKCHNRFFGLQFRRRKYWCIFNYFCVICPESYRIRWNYAALRAITPFKVIEGHRVWYQSKVICDFLLVINSNLAPILHPRRGSPGTTP